MLKKIRAIGYGVIVLIIVNGCQTPTQVSEKDLDLEGRAFSKIEYGQPKELKRAIIMDVRSSFDHQMSRPPRSFHAYWKDWQLQGLQGQRLEKKRQELQRLLALHGVEPLTEVVILGKGLAGQGEEFFMASTLYRLGIDRLRFMTEKQAKKAFMARNLPEVANAPLWSRPLRSSMNCGDEPASEVAQAMKSADVVISKKFMEKGGGPETFFTQELKLKKYRYPKSMRLRIYSPNSQWAYGVAMYLKEQGRRPCVL